MPACRARTQQVGRKSQAPDQYRDLGLRWLEAGQSYLQGWQQFAQRSAGGSSCWRNAAEVRRGDAQRVARHMGRRRVGGRGRDSSIRRLDLATCRRWVWRANKPKHGVSCWPLNPSINTWNKSCARCGPKCRPKHWSWWKPRFASAARSRSWATPGIEDYRELYNLWVECGEKVFAQVAHSESYCKLQAQLGNAADSVEAASAGCAGTRVETFRSADALRVEHGPQADARDARAHRHAGSSVGCARGEERS